MSTKTNQKNWSKIVFKPRNKTCSNTLTKQEPLACAEVDKAKPNYTPPPTNRNTRTEITVYR